MDDGLRELARTLASLTDEEYKAVTSEARGPETDRLIARSKAAKAEEMAAKSVQLARLIDNQNGFRTEGI